MKTKTFLSILIVSFSFLFISCEDGPNLFTLDQDIAFGEQMKDEILYGGDYIVLDEQDYPEAYSYLYRKRDELLESGEVKYKDDFSWEVYIIDQDVVNAFATPGGYMYFYTGLINTLENEAQFTGVIAHEMAHCARRHSTKQMTKAYGFQFMLGILLGEEPSQLTQIAAQLGSGLASLAFSRKDEYEADEFAVKYIAKGTGGQDGNEMATFFDILEELSGPDYTPTFLKTHPSPEDRSEKIKEHWVTYSEGKIGEKYVEEFNVFRNNLQAD